MEYLKYFYLFINQLTVTMGKYTSIFKSVFMDTHRQIVFIQYSYKQLNYDHNVG